MPFEQRLAGADAADEGAGGSRMAEGALLDLDGDEELDQVGLDTWWR